MSNVCDSHLGAHGAYGKTMYYLWLRANDKAKGVSTIPDFARFCKNTKFDHRAFNPEWRCEPKPCKGNPTRNLGNEIWLGKKLFKMCSLKLFFKKTKNDRGPCFTGCQRMKSRCPVLIHWWWIWYCYGYSNAARTLSTVTLNSKSIIKAPKPN